MRRPEGVMMPLERATCELRLAVLDAVLEQEPVPEPWRAKLMPVMDSARSVTAAMRFFNTTSAKEANTHSQKLLLMSGRLYSKLTFRPVLPRNAALASILRSTRAHCKRSD